jgi:hypothetical protein
MEYGIGMTKNHHAIIPLILLWIGSLLVSSCVAPGYPEAAQ